LFGGTFDPPHVGHWLMAQLAYEQLSADQVWFLPAPVPPHKMEQAWSRHALRREMASALIGAELHMTVSDIEQSLPYPSYTVDTVRKCIEIYPDIEFTFLMGTDSLANLPQWHEAGVLTELIRFTVATRTGFPFESVYAKVKKELPALQAQELEMPIVDVSSTFLRQRLLRNQSTCGLIPVQVLDLWHRAH
jgi:nicotinate-nucleotide adenylyltransferase